MNALALVVLGFLVAKLLAQIWMERLNRKNVIAHSDSIPESFRAVVDEPTYRKSVDYTLAKSRFRETELIFDAIVLAIALFSGLLPLYYDWYRSTFGTTIWAQAGFLFSTFILLSIPGMPFDWFSQFRLEAKYGFNTTTKKLWMLDRIKGLILAILLGLPLIALLLKLVDWVGDLWWFWGWAVFVGFQLLMVVLAPVVILPLFNKFTPLPEGPLRDRLMKLAGRTGFEARSIQVMDGSRRSRHSNAFFTGFKRFRKIVLFDTLIQQLSEQELEAVLAHEIGHYKKGHIPKMLVFSTVSLLGGFYLLFVLSEQEWFYQSFRFANPSVVLALLLFSLLSGIFTFWFGPLTHWWSRKYEYEADAYAAEVMSESGPLVGALRKLSEKNLSNLTPHPIYSAFYYSHPTLLEREQALNSLTRFSERPSSSSAGGT